MKSNVRDFLHYCETADFGRITLSKMERHFYRRFNNEILKLCRSLPKPAQTDSILFLMRYAGINLGEDLDFFANFYAPTWSILYWLNHYHALPANRLKKREVANAVTAQSMAMFLHSLDDHLTDGQVPVSPLTLLLRSQAWTIMNRSFDHLAEGLPKGKITVRGFIDNYYSSIQNPEEQKVLDGYCLLFRKQMAIGMVAPLLLSMKITRNSEFTKDLETAYGSFGIAWRFLDDIRDIKCDFKTGTHSVIYLCLPKKMKTHWGNHNNKSRPASKDSLSTVLNHILEDNLINKINEKIGAELETAASIVEAHQLIGLAKEFRCLADPFKKKSF